MDTKKRDQKEIFFISFSNEFGVKVLRSLV